MYSNQKSLNASIQAPPIHMPDFTCFSARMLTVQVRGRIQATA